MRHTFKKKYYLFVGLAVIVLLIRMTLQPSASGRRTYEYLEKEFILNSLHEELSENFTSDALGDCDYRDIIFDETTLSLTLIEEDLVEGHRIKNGGEYIPHECKPKFSTAIIVPYRDRPEQLRGFLVYMHTFLRRQRIHYRLYVIEQVDTQSFNRAKLMNIGAVAAMKAGFPCLILHDVDLLPLQLSNLYACTKCPRHMSSSIDKFRFVLPYQSLFGGAVAMIEKQYKYINGMSNEYFGWGGEDDDLYARIEANNLTMCRFQMEISRYHMVEHESEHKGESRKVLLSFAKKRMEADGLNTLKYTEVATVMHPLFTHIMVDL